jgi:hypothetical protein
MRAELPGPIEASLSGRLKKKTDQILGKDVLPLAVPYRFFLDMESNVERAAS